MPSEWPKRIHVDKDIVALLSRRTYNNFAQALREVVSNAYDADATLVEIHIDQVGDRIRIEDNGRGMTPDDFDYYLNIAARTRQAVVTQGLQRRRIGQFGIGFLSIFPFCETLEIASTAEGSDLTFTARINAGDYTAKAPASVDVGTIPVYGSERRDPTIKRQHGTTISLVGLTSLVRDYFAPRADASRKSIQSWPWLERLTWELQQMLPIAYGEDSQLGKILKNGSGPPLEVRLNRHKLVRNEIEGASILDGPRELVTLPSGIEFAYAIVSPRTTISPIEARGLQLRLKNVGIGTPTYFGLNIVGKLYAKLVWLGGEVHITKGLDDELSIDRGSFTWSPAYQEFSEYFLERLRSLAYRLDEENAAIRDIKDFVQGNMKRDPASAKREAVEKRLNALKETGYRVSISEDPAPPRSAPVTIVPETKTATYYPDHPALTDSITVSGKRYEVTYESWDYRQDQMPACRVESGRIVFNRTYPPFSSSRYGLVTKRLAALLEIGRSEATSVEELVALVLARLPREIMELGQ